MYLQEIVGILQSYEVKIKYDCDGKFENCGKEKMLKLRYAEKNFKDNNGKHICRQCQLRLKNPMKKQEIKNKVKKTCEEKYGGMPMNSQENIQKRKEKFQDENYKQQWVEKHKITSLKKYGVDHPMQLKSTQNKQKQTMQEKYGVDYPYQSPEIIEKMKKNNFKKYGVENVAQLPEIQIKMAKATLEKYGVEHYNQLPEMKNYLRENCKIWLKESWENPWNKGVPKSEEQIRKISDTVCNKINKGEWNGGGNNTYKGRYKSKKCIKKNPMFRSGYELKTHFYLDNDDSVDYYDYEPFQVEYQDTEGKTRRYTIDFIVKFKNKKTLLIEVKNNYTQEKYLNSNKYESIKELCQKEDFALEIWSNDKITSLNLDLEEILSKKEVKLFNKI